MVAPNERIEPTLNFENIEDVLALTRRLAEEDYQRHLQAVLRAQTQEERLVAIEGLNKSADAAAQVDSALKNAITSGTEFRNSTVEAIKGNEAVSTAGFKRAGMNMEKGAENLDHYAGYVPQSKFFAAAISAVQKADQFAANAEVKANEKVEAFARGLKAFAKGMSDFGKKVSAMPDQIKKAVKEKAAEISEAAAIARAQAEFTARMHMRNIGRKVDAAVDAANAKLNAGKEAVVAKAVETKEVVVAGVNEAKAKVNAGVNAAKEFDASMRQSAWETIDRFSSAAIQLKNDVSNAVEARANTVERHAKAAVGVAADVAGAVGGMFKQFGRDIAAKYDARVNAVAAEQAQRKEPQGASKAVQRLLAGYVEDRAPMAAALGKANVIALGYSGSGSSPRVVNVTNDTWRPDNAQVELRFALAQDRTDKVRELLQKGQDLNVVYAHSDANGAQYSSVLYAAKSAEQVRMLLNAGVSPNAAPGIDMQSPVSHAIMFMPESERAAAVISMINHGADPNGGDSRWVKPLATALMERDVGLTNILGDAGAKVDVEVFVSFAQMARNSMESAQTPDVRSREMRTTEQLVKSLYAHDRAGMDALLKDSRVQAIDNTPGMKEVFDKVKPADLETSREVAKLG